MKYVEKYGKSALRTIGRCFVWTCLFLVGAALFSAESIEPGDRIGHERHRFKHGEPLPVTGTSSDRFSTDRVSAVELPLTVPEPVFSFLIFGDRTGGPPGGVSVLADAVREANLLGPDFVMTVGDMVEGLADTDAWIKGMKEYKSIMNELLCPWYPTPGNHDTCWRYFPKDAPPPRNEHDPEYEKYFGPLRYSFEHKNCRFIILYSDEGDPETGKKGSRINGQQMSDEQFRWLESALKQAAGADRVFIFIHHPRWFRGNNYGTHWDRVHRLLVDAGNVSAVFGGHVHQMLYQDRDGVEYFTLPAIGGNHEILFPRAGHLQAFYRVTVRKNRLDVAAIPIGTLLDPRELTGRIRGELLNMVKQVPRATVRPIVEKQGGYCRSVSFPIRNPGSDPVELTVARHESEGSRTWEPAAVTRRIEPGKEAAFVFELIEKEQPSPDDDVPVLRANVEAVRFMPGSRVPVPWGLLEIPLSTDQN